MWNTCIYASNVENVEKKGFGGKLSIVLVQKKKTYFKIHARWVLSKVSMAVATRVLGYIF